MIDFETSTEHKAAMLAFALRSAATELVAMAAKDLSQVHAETETLAQTHRLLSHLLQAILRSQNERAVA